MQTLLNLLAGVSLLVWGTHIVRTGILRVYGGPLRRLLRSSVENRLAAFFAGVGVTGLIQSSTATALIVAAFAGQGLIGTAPALAVMLGADVGSRDLFTGVLLPIVILTMLIERFSITAAEEGIRQALVRAGWSTAVAVAAYPLFHSQLAAHLMFGFPELVLAVIGVLVWIGGYTGYRVADLIRFRSLALPAEGPT